MISSKKRRQGSSVPSNPEAYSRTLPRPSDIARNLATPTYPSSSPYSSSSSSSAHHHQQPIQESLSNSRQTPVSLGMTSFGSGKHGIRAVANPYDDLSLYTSQINAVHKPEIRSGDSNQAYRGRVSATSGGYFGYNKPVEPSGQYGFNKHSAPSPRDYDGRFGYNQKSPGSIDTRGYYGYNKPAKNDTVPSGYFGYPKSNETEPKAHYGYNKSTVSDSTFSGKYEPRRSKSAKAKPSKEPPSSMPQQVSSSGGYSMTLPWSSRYGKPREPLEGDTFPSDPPSGAGNPSHYIQTPTANLHHGFIYEGHTHCPSPISGDNSYQRYSGEEYNNAGCQALSAPVAVGTGPSNHLHQFVTSTPKHRREAPQPPEFEDHSFTTSSPSSFSTPSSSSGEHTATFPASFSRAGSSPQAPPHLHIRCDLASRFHGDEMADQQRSQSMSPRVFRNPKGGPGQATADLVVRETKTPPASSSSAYDPPTLENLMGNMYDFQRQLQTGGRSHHKPKKGHDPRHQGSIPAPPKQAGLAATLNYHQQLRKELGMPQSSSPVPVPCSSMAAPFKFQQHHHLSDSNIPSTTAPVASSNVISSDFSGQYNNSTFDREIGLLTTLAYDGNSRRFQDAFQNLHGHHNSTPHLPSASSTTQPVFEDQPLFGSDPNLLRKNRQQGFDTFYDNIFFGPPLGSKKTSNSNQPTANATFLPSNPVTRTGGYHLEDDTSRFLAQFDSQPGSVYTQASRSSSDLPTSASAFSPFQQSQNHAELRDWGIAPAASMAPPVSSSLANFPFPTPGGESYYSSTNLQGLCTLPRTSHSVPQLTGPGGPTRTISLAQKEPSYEEITNITPAPGKDTTSRSASMQIHPDITNPHLERPRTKNFPIPEVMHGFAPLASSGNTSIPLAAQNGSLLTYQPSDLSHPSISSGMGPSQNSDEQPFSSHQPELSPFDRPRTGKIPTSDLDLAIINPSQREYSTGKNQVNQVSLTNQNRAVQPGSARPGSIKAKSERLPGSVSDRAHRFEQKACAQGETKRKTGIPTFTFVRLRSKNAKTEKQDNKTKEKSKSKREVRDLDRSFEKEEKSRSGNFESDNDSSRDSFGFSPTPADNLDGGSKTHHGVYGLSSFPKSSFPTHPTAAMVSSPSAAAAAAATSAKSSIPMLTFSSSRSSSSPPRLRMSNPEDAVSKEAAFLAVTGSDVTAVAPARGQQTFSMHETGTGSVDVDSFSDFLLASGSSHNYHLFSRRKKPLPASELESSPEYARLMSEVGHTRPAGGDAAIVSARSSSLAHAPAQTMTSSANSTPTTTTSHPQQPSAPSVGGDNNNENDDEDDDFINKVCRFEMISRRKVSPTSSAAFPSATATKSPTTSVGKSPTSSKIFFSSDGLGWKGGGGRGSGGSAGSGTAGIAGNSSQNPTIPLVSPYSPHGFVGEKVFTRDTATTRVSASLLQNLVSPSPAGGGATSGGSGTGSKAAGHGHAQRVQSSESTSTPSTNSLTSVSSLSWNSDRSDIVSGAMTRGSQSQNRRGSGGEGAGKRAASNPNASKPGSDIMTNSDPCVFPSSKEKPVEDDFGSSGVPLREEDIIYDDVPTPVPSPRVLPAHVTNRSEAAKHRGGVFDLPPQTSLSDTVLSQQQNQTSDNNNISSNSSSSPNRVTPTRETPKRFVTLSSTDRDSFPAPAVKPLSPSANTSFPYITPGPASSLHVSPPGKSPSPSSSSSEQLGPFTNGDVSGSSSGHLPLYSATYSSNRDSIRSGSSTGSGGQVGSAKTSSSSSASSHRNTFEGMDFEFQELTSQQQQLALRHKEVVAERKREQERERMDRQRLEDILKMCEEYQQEVESARPTSSSSATASFSTNISVATANRASSSAPFGFPSNGTSQTAQRENRHQLQQNQTPSTVPTVSSRDQAPPPYSQIMSTIQEQPPPPYSPKAGHPATSPRPPAQLDINTSLTSSPTSSIDRKNKIKTNGSLMLGSPGSPYKEFATSFSYPAQVSSTASTSTCKTVESSSTYSSNSEDEAVGSSEDTGTIKKRPGMGDGIGAIVGGNLSRQPYPQHPSSNSPLASSYSPQSSPHAARTRRSRDASGWPATSNTPSGSGSRNGAIALTADVSDGNIVTTTTRDYNDSAAASLSPRVSPKSCGQPAGRANHNHRATASNNVAAVSYGDSRILSSSSTPTTTTASTITTTATTKDQPSTPKELRHQSSTSSSSSSHTLRRSNCSSSGGSTQSLSEINIAMDTPSVSRKEDTPTPVNSDSEQAELNGSREEPQLSPRVMGGSDFSPLFSVMASVASPGNPLSAKEECQVRGHLESLKLSRTQLLVRTAELRRQIAEIELQESEAVRELDLETKLLEGEHRDQMQQLQQEQEKLTEMKRCQQEALDSALREREKEQRAINLERQKLLVLEEQQHALHDRMMRTSGSPGAHDAAPGSPTSGPSSPSGSVSSVSSPGRHLELEELTIRRARLQQELERQRRIFDDLEFQQLEAEARFESEREQLNTRLLAQQAELLQKYKEREERLQQIDIQQKFMVSAVKESLGNFRQQRLDLIEAYRKEKAKIALCDRQIGQLCRVLSLPVPAHRDDSDDDLEDPVEGQSQLSPKPNQHQLYLDGEGTPTELRRPFDLSLDSPTGSGSASTPSIGLEGETASGPQRKKSATLLEIERNRSLFIEQQGSLIIDQERRRIEELRRRAADEGRAQWEERRRAADESIRLQADDRQSREVNCKSFNSVESEDSSVASSCDTHSEKETSLSGGEEHLEKLAELEKLLAQAQSEKVKLVEEQVRIRESEMLALQKNEVLERELQQVKLRERHTQMQARPMTRFLPNTSRDFDLRAHIEGAGHLLDACPHVIITTHSCRGWLHKMGGRIKTWKKRWFVFDRMKRKVFYFTDKSELKLKGSVCFQAIEEVYADHLKTVKSPSPKLTFCMKTFDRTYFLVAPSPETMTIWIDVLFSGAEGYQQFYES